ncbi:hypothetical protein VN97_g13003, partial [Penicillium thymicola]
TLLIDSVLTPRV